MLQRRGRNTKGSSSSRLSFMLPPARCRVPMTPSMTWLMLRTPSSSLLSIASRSSGSDRWSFAVGVFGVRGVLGVFGVFGRGSGGTFFTGEVQRSVSSSMSIGSDMVAGFSWMIYKRWPQLEQIRNINNEIRRSGCCALQSDVMSSVVGCLEWGKFCRAVVNPSADKLIRACSRGSRVVHSAAQHSTALCYSTFRTCCRGDGQAPSVARSPWSANRSC